MPRFPSPWLSLLLGCLLALPVSPATGVEVEAFFIPASFLTVSPRLSDSGGRVWSGPFDCAPFCRQGVWQIGGAGVSTPLAVMGDPAPGFGAELGELWSSVDVVWNGQLLLAPFELVDTGTSTTKRALWTGLPGALQAVAVEHAAVPDPSLPGVLFTNPAVQIRLNRAGQICFGARLGGADITTANDDTIWCGAPGNLEILLREGDPAPGRLGETFVGLEQGHPSNNVVVGPYALDDAGRILITARTESGLGLWLAGAGGTTLLAFEGTEAFGSGLHFHDLSSNRASFDGGGGAGFHALLEGGTVRAVFAGLPSASRIVAKSGDMAPARPGGDPRGGYYKLPSFLAANGWGETLFMSTLLDHPAAVTKGIYAEIGPSGVVVPILLEGETAPGTDPGVTFSGGVNFAYFNAARQAAFEMTLGGSASSANDQSIWVWDPDQGPVLLAREGRALEVAPGDQRIVRSLGLLSGGLYDGWRQAFNERGEILFYASFFDDTRALIKARVQPSTVVFDDGFESGDLTSWSSSP